MACVAQTIAKSSLLSRAPNLLEPLLILQVKTAANRKVNNKGKHKTTPAEHKNQADQTKTLVGLFWWKTMLKKLWRLSDDQNVASDQNSGENLTVGSRSH